MSRQRRGSQRGRLQLTVVPGDEYLASIEPESLQVLTYCKLSGLPVEVHTACLPWKSPSWRFPVMRQGSKKTVSRSADDIITAIKEMGFNIDRRLTESAVAESLAYSALLTDRLLPALLYSRWMDTQTYMEVTSGQYGRMTTFPLSSLYLSWRYRSVQRLLMTGVAPGTNMEQLGIELQARAEECLNLLSYRLGDKEFFNGDSLTSLDALVFGYLEIMLQTPLPAPNQLYLHLHSSNNLLLFCSRVRAKAFPDKKQRVAAVVPVKPSLPLWKDPKVWLSVGVAALLLGVQAARVGLLTRLLSLALSKRILNN